MRITTEEFAKILRKKIEPSRVILDQAECELLAQDVFSKEQAAALVVRPSNTLELSKAVAAANAAEFAIIARGGGMSYTGGLIPQNSSTMLVDMSAMNRILDINVDDMYVQVECGCTWQDLHKALEGSGLRTPYWGTLSGSKASIGGSLSQNSIFWGSGHHGFSVDSLIGLEVVVANGDVINTGSAAQTHASPFLRHFGPDLTGLFTCDSGALGCKAIATLRLCPELNARRFLSFDFPDFKSQAKAMSEISRRDLAAESFGFDPYLQTQRLKRASLVSDVKSLAGVMKSAGGLAKR